MIPPKSLVPASAEHKVTLLISSFCKADNSDSDWPSDSAAAVVRLISRSFNSLRVLFLIPAKSLVPASAEHKVRPLISSVCKTDNSDSDWPSDSAAAVVRLILHSLISSRVLGLIPAKSLVPASAEHKVTPLISSFCKADNSDSDWPSASAAAVVRLISHRLISSRVLCLIPAKSLVPASAEHKATPLIVSFCKADNSDSDWPSASAAAVVRFILHSSSSSRVLCLIEATSLVTASAEHLGEKREKRMTRSNFGNKDASSTALFDVKKGQMIDKEHLRGFGTCFKI